MARVERYYEKEGRSHDYILRCKDCRGIETYANITKLGCCSKCGNRRFSEITILSEAEMEQIKNGTIEFDGRDQFIAEFASVE